MKIGHHDLDERVLVTAEIGSNHEGSVDLAEELIGLAAAAGADAVKLQTIEPRRLVSYDQTARLEQLERYRLPDEAWPRLRGVADRAGVLFLSTPFSLDAVRLLDPLVPAFKVASGDNDFLALLRAVARTGKPLIVSTGLTDRKGAAAVKAVVEQEWAALGVDPGLVLLHCVVSYPTAAGDANLLALRDLATLGVTIGYSDHTIGVDAAVLSVALGARLIEKHFTIDKAYSGFRDHQLSADPTELAHLVERVRAAEELLGVAAKRVLPVEETVRDAVRRGIASAADLPAGHLVGHEDLMWVRPAGRLRPGQEGELVGRRLRRPVAAGEHLGANDVEAT